MKINKQAFELIGITLEEYIDWCKDNNFPSYKNSTRNEFFTRVKEKRIVRDSQTGKLINKHRG